MANSDRYPRTFHTDDPRTLQRELEWLVDVLKRRDATGIVSEVAPGLAPRITERDSVLQADSSGRPYWGPVAGLQVQKFPNDIQAFARWNFEGDTNDSSGHGRHFTAGTSNFIDIYPGFLGRVGGTGLEISRTDQDFNLPGDVTIIAMVQANDVGISNILAFRGIGAAQAQNHIFNFSAYDNTLVRNMQTFSESGASVAATFNGGLLPYIHNLVEVGVTRIANVYQFWVNGAKNGAPSAALVTPDGGTSSVLVSGGNGNMTIAAIEFHNRGLSDPEMKQRYNVTMGRVFGEV